MSLSEALIIRWTYIINDLIRATNETHEDTPVIPRALNRNDC